MSDPIEAQVREVFVSVLGVAPALLSRDTSPDTLDSWDSMSHISLMLAVEGACGVQFEPDELVELRTFGAIVDRVRATHRG
jgi:acyl carrier protein